MAIHHGMGMATKLLALEKMPKEGMLPNASLANGILFLLIKLNVKKK
jgi:hypothetical protein